MRRRLGIGLMLSGAVLIVVGVVGWLTSDSEKVTLPTTSTEPPQTTTTTVAATTTATTTTTTSTSTTSTTTTTTTTTTTIPQEPIEEFVFSYAAATEAGDVDFLTARLHPIVIERGGAETCRQFVADVVTLIRGYRLTGPVTGPTPQEFALTNRTVILDTYSAPVAFEFQGSTVEDTAVFAYVDLEVRWFTNCGGDG